MTFLYPEVLWLLVPLLIFFFKASARTVIRAHSIILILLIFSLARPVKEQTVQTVALEAKDIIIALDASYSMQASDISPTRYEFAKKTINLLLKQNLSDNIMLIAFTTNPLLLSPPTTDHALIQTALKSLNPAFILTKGTSLQRLFKKLLGMQPRHKTLILITDGGEALHAEKLAALLQKADLSLITLATGTAQGATIPLKNGTLLKNKQDDLVISRINPALEDLTSMVQGTYIESENTPEQTAERITQALDTQTAQQIEKKEHRYWELYPVPLFIALLMFGLLHTSGIKYLLVLFSLFGIQTQAGVLDGYHLHRAYTAYGKGDFNTSYKQLKKIETPSLQSQMALADTYYKQGSYRKALHIYLFLRSHSATVKQQLYYNSANCYAQLGLYDKAKLYYTKTLQLGNDEAAKHNLGLVVFLKEKREHPLGIAHPKAQSSHTGKNLAEDSDKKKKKKEAQSGTGSGSGGEMQSKKSKKNTQKLLQEEHAQHHPLSSKVYELINKGYIRETQPW